MRGTGSHDVEAEDLFVPEERIFSALERRARVKGPTNRIHGFACVGLGVARAAIDTFVELASVKIPCSSSGLLRERVIVQAQVGEAEALLCSGRTFLFEVVDEVWQTVLAAQATHLLGTGRK